MPVRKLLLAFLFFISLLVSKGQQIEIRPSVGIGVYDMSVLKDLMHQSASRMPFDVKTTENFPPYAFYQMDLVFYPERKLGWGFTAGFYSTGARIHYADYSGSYREDMKVGSFNLGIMASQKVALGHQWQGYFEFATGLKFNKLSYVGEIRIGEETQSEEEDALSNGWWATPQLRLGRQVYKNLALSVFAGYEFMLIKNIESYNEGYAGPEIDWSGIRAGVSVSFIQK